MPSPRRASTSRQTVKVPSTAAPLLLPSDDPDTFLTLMADTLRLSSETLTMAYVYIHRYKRWSTELSSSSPTAGGGGGGDDDGGDKHEDGDDDEDSTRNTNPNTDILDEHTLSLASLSLATKATESPRRLREFLIPAYTLQHPTASTPLTFPSPLYDALRSTLVAAELLLLRVLRFDLRVPLPYEYLPRLLERALTLSDTLAAVSVEERLESRVVDLKDTALGRAVWVKVGEAMTSYRVCNFFPGRAVAAACVYYVAVVERGLRAPGEREVWLRKVAGERVEYEDFVDALDEIKGLTAPRGGQ